MIERDDFATTFHQIEIRNRLIDNASSADHRTVSDSDAGKDDRAGTYTSSVTDAHLNDRPLNVETYFRCRRPAVVAENDIRTDENTVADDRPRKDSGAMADARTVPDPCPVHTCARRYQAIVADDSAADDVSKLQNSRSGTDVRIRHIRSRIDNRRRMDAQTRPLFARSWT